MKLLILLLILETAHCYLTKQLQVQRKDVAKDQALSANTKSTDETEVYAFDNPLQLGGPLRPAKNSQSKTNSRTQDPNIMAISALSAVPETGGSVPNYTMVRPISLPINSVGATNDALVQPAVMPQIMAPAQATKPSQNMDITKFLSGISPKCQKSFLQVAGTISNSTVTDFKNKVKEWAVGCNKTEEVKALEDATNSIKAEIKANISRLMVELPQTMAQLQSIIDDESETVSDKTQDVKNLIGNLTDPVQVRILGVIGQAYFKETIATLVHKNRKGPMNTNVAQVIAQAPVSNPVSISEQREASVSGSAADNLDASDPRQKLRKFLQRKAQNE